jgi:DDE family transposase
MEDINQLGRHTGQATRLRTVTPHRLFFAVVSTLASVRVESLADLLRAFNHQNSVTVAYKAFYNRLARAGFATFMREMFARLVERLSVQTLTPEGERAVARFKDIVIQDGSSFALKSTLHGTFPGRFTTIEPAAVEVHATYSGFFDEVRAVQIAPDTEAERQFLPDPSTLPDRLLLADRGYPSVPYFEAVREQGGSFIVRLTRSYDPCYGPRGSTVVASTWPRACGCRGGSLSTPRVAWTSMSSSNARTSSSAFASWLSRVATRP